MKPRKRPQQPEISSQPPERVRLLDEFMILTARFIKAKGILDLEGMRRLREPIDEVLDDYNEIRSGKPIVRYHTEPVLPEFSD